MFLRRKLKSESQTRPAKETIPGLDFDFQMLPKNLAMVAPNFKTNQQLLRTYCDHLRPGRCEHSSTPGRTEDRKRSVLDTTLGSCHAFLDPNNAPPCATFTEWPDCHSPFEGMVQIFENPPSLFHSLLQMKSVEFLQCDPAA